jgi:hypothetical protein
VTPNPANGSAQFTFVIENSVSCSIDLLTIGGTVVKNVFAGNAIGGARQSAYTDLSDMASGTYVYRLTSEETILAGKLVVTH